MNDTPIELGLISDTHGLLRPEALDALTGVRHILHAGDVGDLEILQGLEKIAPVTAVVGNTDYGATARELPRTAVHDVFGDGELLIYLLHIREQLDLEPQAAGVRAVLFGHTHEPHAEERGGIWWLNPGSAGPRRFRLPVTVMRLTAHHDGRLEPRRLDLPV